MNTKKLSIKCLALLMLSMFAFINSASAQELKGKIPATSLGQRIEQDFGLGTVSVKYYRPNTKGRKIFGGIEPYGTVWRTGANNATVITLTDTLQMEGHTVAPGSYSLFSIPGATEWTIILNKNTQQWGAYTYNEKEDLLRFKVKPVKLPAKVETLTIQFADVTANKALLQILWENTGVNVKLSTDIDKQVMANIQEALKGQQKPYFAAVWYYNHNTHLPEALSLMQEADKAQPNFYPTKYWLAKLYLKNGNKPAAIASARESLKLATEQHSQEYIRKASEVLTEASVK
ncbi:DUF2911 domain-containing protein [Mucilaginibacter pedocola]|uniref:DUF2911 domain-containing protein n=1 Tax=Mucilaginibacter pedocola TaxID=1792845 RepID=A0A1S9PJ15_9SPHI|nr:DUF2911 domain-containing protein [Mucilaginibacter pedocola]OOQ60961.1 hypothetical protein BC343_23265 [Mucilaginibacter pedocola]